MLINQFTKEPLILYGEGSYALSSVKEIDGTEAYLKLAKKKGECQDKESLIECHEREFITNGIDQCKCVPYWLRHFSKEVKKF